MSTSKLSLSIKDSTTGKKTPPQEVTPKRNGGKTVVKGSQLSKTPNGNEWTAKDLNNVKHEVTGQVAQGENVTVSTMGHNIEFLSSPIAKNINFAPSDNMVFSADPDIVIDNYISWDFDDYDGDPQTGWRIRIFPDFVVKSADFDPDTNPFFVGELTGADTTNQVSISHNDGFISGEMYWAYVQVAKQFQGKDWLGDWEAASFVVVIEQPQSPIMSIYTDNDNSLNNIVIQSTDNLLSDDNGDFTSGVGGWSANTTNTLPGASGDTADTVLDIAQTSIPLRQNLSATTAISSIPVGAIGYVQTVGALSGTGTGTFKVSGETSTAVAALSFPTGNTPFWVQIDNEQILLRNNVDGTSKTADTFTIEQRGYNGTTATSHAVGAQVTYGIQDDIYVGSVGTISWSSKVAETKTVMVGRGGTGGGASGTVSSNGVYPLLSRPSSQDNHNGTFLWVPNPGSLKAGDKGFVTQLGIKVNGQSIGDITTNVTITNVSYVGTSSGPIIIGRVSKTVSGSTQSPVTSIPFTFTSTSAIDNYFASANNSGTACLFPNIAAGATLSLDGHQAITKNGAGLKVTLAQAVTVAQTAVANGGWNSNNATHLVGGPGVLHIEPIKSGGGFNLPNQIFQIPAGTEIFWTPPSQEKSLAKVTISPGFYKGTSIKGGDYLTIGKSSTAASTATTPTPSTTASALNTAGTSASSSSATGTLTPKVEIVGYNSVNATQDFVVGFDPASAQPITFSSGDGSTPVYAIGNQNSNTSWTPGASADLIYLPLNALQITGTNLPTVTANQYVNYQVDAIGVPLGATISSNTASSVLPNGQTTFTVILTNGNIITPAYEGLNPDGTGSGQQYGGLTLTLIPSSSLIIKAGATKIPVVPFIPDANYPLGHASVSVFYPPYFGGELSGSTTTKPAKQTHALVMKTTQSGNAEISITNNGWFSSTSSWNAQANTVPVNAGLTYGFAAWATVVAGSASPTVKLFLDWYDQFGNWIQTDDGTRSLSNPTRHNPIPGVVIGSAGGSKSWKPVAMVAKSPISTVATGANFYSVTTTNNLLQGTGSSGSNQLVLNSSTFTSITSGTLIELDQYPVSELVQVSSVSGNTLTLVSNLLYDHTNAPMSTGSAYTLGTGITTALVAGTEITMGSGVTAVTTAPVKAGETTVPVRITSGTPTLTADTMTLGASYACPRILLEGVSANSVYGISNPMVKALTPDLYEGFTVLSTTLPTLQSPIPELNTPSPDRAFVLPPSTPTEGAGTIFLFDPTNDNGSYELHQGGGDPILDTVLSASASAGTTSLLLDSVEGLSINSKLVLNVYVSLPSTTQTNLDIRQAMYTGEMQEINEASQQLEQSLSQTKTYNGLTTAQLKKESSTVFTGTDTTETVLIDPSWDGSNNVVLQTPLKYNYQSGTQVNAFTTSITQSFAYAQKQGTPVAVFNWNRAGYTNTSGRSYYYSLEKSEDFGVTWNPVWNGSQLTPDSSGMASITDYDVIPNTVAFYRVTANSSYIDASSNSIVVNGVTSPPAQAPIVENQSWWLSSTSNESLRFPVLVQNGIQETQKHPVGVFYPMGASRPLTIAGVVQGRDATITIVWTDEDNWQNFIDMLNLGETLVLIDPVESERRYIFVSQDITATHQAASGKPYRSLSITYVEAAPPNFGFMYGQK